MLLAITLLPAQGAYAGVTDYIRNKVNAATSYVTSLPTYKTYVSPTVNQISNNSYVSALTGGLGYIRGGIKTGLVSGGSALTKGLSSIRGGIKTGLVSGGKYIGLGAKSALIRPDLSKMFEVGRDPENGGRALVYRKMESRTEYSMTDTRTNKTIPINESVFRGLVKNNRPKID